VDLSKFSDTVNHDGLMHRVARKVHDKRVLRLIGKYLRAGVMVQGRLQETRLGVPQGGPLSPLLANVIKELTGRSWFVSMDYRYEKLAEYLRGWMNYFGISEYYRPIPEIDHWLRRRLRRCYFKQWRRAKTKVRKLRKLGTSLHAAISVAISRKGPWRLSRRLATQTGMTNKWLKDQGLLSVKELWVNIHCPATAR
jgi:hypothetical protein